MNLEPVATGQMYIGGQWVDAFNGATRNVVNPADESLAGVVAFGGRAESERAIDAAARALPDWQKRSAQDRSKILKRAADLIRQKSDKLAVTLTLEQGKPLAEARGEVLMAADTFEWFAEEGRRAYGRLIPSAHPLKRSLVLKQGIGVVGTITPWNFPAALPARKIGPALAAGCTVVSRPADQTPLTLVGIFACLEEAGLPAGVANLVIGDAVAVADVFFERPEVRKISFTGSTAVGKQLVKRSADRLTRLSLELGGHAPLIVFPDADVDAVARFAVQGKFRNNGQVCISPSRFYLHESIRREFTEAAVELTRRLRLGSGLDNEVQVGPMIEPRFVENAQRLCDNATQRGAVVLSGGKRPEQFAKGYYFEPTVLDHLDRSMAILTEEPFAPIMPLQGFEEIDAVLKEANDTPYGLAAYVFTNDLTTTIRMAEGLEAGIIGINDPVPTAVHAPFGGMKESGMGRELGQEGLEAYLETKYVSIGLK